MDNISPTQTPYRRRLIDSSLDQLLAQPARPAGRRAAHDRQDDNQCATGADGGAPRTASGGGQLRRRPRRGAEGPARARSAGRVAGGPGGPGRRPPSRRQRAATGPIPAHRLCSGDARKPDLARDGPARAGADAPDVDQGGERGDAGPNGLRPPRRGRASSPSRRSAGSARIRGVGAAQRLPRAGAETERRAAAGLAGELRREPAGARRGAAGNLDHQAPGRPQAARLLRGLRAQLGGDRRSPHDLRGGGDQQGHRERIRGPARRAAGRRAGSGLDLEPAQAPQPPAEALSGRPCPGRGGAAPRRSGRDARRRRARSRSRRLRRRPVCGPSSSPRGRDPDSTTCARPRDGTRSTSSPSWPESG